MSSSRFMILWSICRYQCMWNKEYVVCRKHFKNFAYCVKFSQNFVWWKCIPWIWHLPKYIVTYWYINVYCCLRELHYSLTINHKTLWTFPSRDSSSRSSTSQSSAAPSSSAPAPKPRISPLIPSDTGDTSPSFLFEICEWSQQNCCYSCLDSHSDLHLYSASWQMNLRNLIIDVI